MIFDESLPDMPFDKIVETIPELKRLRNCSQPTDHHGEGDVLTHTRLVCEAMRADSEWLALSPRERSICYAAAIFHDIGKAAVTKVGPDGAITSHGHATRGARMARRILYEFNTPFGHREAIIGLVRWHGIPLHLHERDDPQRDVFLASQTARCDLLAALARADVLGRTARDARELLDRVEFFRDFCSEQACANSPYTFPSDHTRFTYFQKENRNPSAEVYDDTICTATVMSGLPGAGKSTWIREHAPGLPVICLDDLREEMEVDATDEQGGVVQEARERARRHLRAGENFVWDATNISRRLRGGLIRFLSSYRARIRIVYIETLFEELMHRNRRSGSAVPRKVLERLLDKLEVPDLTEAHAMILVTNPGNL